MRGRKTDAALATRGASGAARGAEFRFEVALMSVDGTGSGGAINERLKKRQSGCCNVNGALPVSNQGLFR